MPTAPKYVNIHGRKAGRGWRPLLLILKLVFVGGFLGGLLCVLVLVFAEPQPATAEAWSREAELISRFYLRVIVPSLVGAMLTGAALMYAHFAALFRMRWLRAKLALAALCIPTLHVVMRGRSVAFHQAVERGDFAAAAELRSQLSAGTAAALGLAVALMILGRIKPRLGQNYARAQSAPTRESSSDEIAGE